MVAESLDVATPANHEERFADVRALLEEEVAEGAFPGAVVGVLHRGSIATLQATGGFTFAADSAQVLAGTCFDLASVTKVVATTAMAMLLWQRGALRLELPLGELLPGFLSRAGGDTDRALVTLRMLLAHSSGLPAYEPLFESCADAEALFEATMQLPLVACPGQVGAYSDPGFILLGRALEILAGESLESFCEREVFKPLGMTKTRFRPGLEEGSQIPPTEFDRAFRKQVVQGEVHDENCFVLGGISGHAGLFAPAVDLLRFSAAMLRPLRTEAGAGLFSAETVRLFTQAAGLPPGSSRALGWDTPSGERPAAGQFFSSTSFGHLGYTGTSLWIDPVKEVSIALLTNRTYPTRENKRIQKTRPLVHDAIMQVLHNATG